MVDWSEILAKHGPQVWRTTYRILRHHADAYDCYQETFLAVWQLTRIRRITEWGPLLTCLATRKAIDRLRQRGRVAARTESLESVPEPIGEFADPLQAARFEELIDHLRFGIAELPEKQAEVAWLSCVEELSHQEIAIQLEIPTGEVRVLLHRARARLRHHFAPEFTDRVEEP